MILVEGLALNVDQQNPHGKADFAIVFQDLMEAVSSGGQCLFTAYAFFPPPILHHPNAWYTKVFCWAVPKIGFALRLFNIMPGIACFNLPIIFNQSKAFKLATGMPMTFGGYIKSGKRCYTLERHINTRFGISRKDDTLPSRLTDVPQIEGRPDTKVPLERLKTTYYRARGWDQNGIPTPHTLRKLKLNTLASYKKTCEDFKNK